ncbi:hypothetical protein PCASD_01903 [Puccinia coronata f. sp. avenae]|uniref:Cohesin loading factor n=1 Tax=Puccinia coronata f. sp. avenae TaxID=200324 RepID=A0A2N5VJM1_9BASI|nr:hypothetical protein PCASD_24180 [Puccinia coronata f. sp. avenae]PLW50195.1 hypothetical protein PCASD_01903 [Puccinia coronata f. sp. avenae]
MNQPTLNNPLEQQPSDSLPPYILLLHLTQLHLRQARQLIPALSTRPSWLYAPLGTLHYPYHPPTPDPHSEQAYLSSAVSTYRRHISIAIACLESLISLASSAAAAAPIPIEINLFALSQLAQILISETHEYPIANQIVQHALTLSRQRDALTPFKLSLSESLLAIQAADPTTSFRQIKKQAERCIQLTFKNQVVDPRYVPWYYRWQLLLCHMSYERAKDFPAALAALRNMLSLAESRNDAELWIACKAHEIKLAMDRHEWALVGQLFSSVIPMIELPIPPPQDLPPSPHPPDQPQPVPHPPRQLVTIGQQLKNYIMLLLIIYYSIIGQSDSAKWWLKHLRNEMDSPKREEGEVEGVYKIYLQSHSPQSHQRQPGQMSPTKLSFNSASTTPRKRMFEGGCKHTDSPQLTTTPTWTPSDSTKRGTQYIIISIMPRELMYTLTYLVSLAVHFDGHGKSPKSLIYAQEGLKQVDRQLVLGFQSLAYLDRSKEPLGYSPSILNSMGAHLRVLMAIKTEINLMASQIAIVRSDFHHADQLLVETIKIACDEHRWDFYSPRISFLKSMLSHATGNLPSARQSLLTTLFLVNGHVKSSHPQQPMRIGMMSELSTLAKACYVLLRLAESDDRPTPPSHHHHHHLDRYLISPHEVSRSFAVDRLIHELALLVKVSLPNVAMAIHIVLAVSCGEIVKAKHHLTSALNEANKTSNTHLKMILLGLLSTMFLNTRSDQATKMLKSCYKLSQGFSSGHQRIHYLQQPPHPTVPLQPRPAHENAQFADVVVGNSSLGLCVGRKLVEIYETQSAVGSGCAEDGNAADMDRMQNSLKKDRLILSNLAHQRVLDETPLL